MFSCQKIRVRICIDCFSHTHNWSPACRGRFGELKECTNKKTSKRSLVKCVPSAVAEGEHEFNILKTVLHETVLQLLATYSTKSTLFLIFEDASGEHAAQRLSLRRRYSEDCVAYIIRQVTLDWWQIATWRHGSSGWEGGDGSGGILLLKYNVQS